MKGKAALSHTRRTLLTTRFLSGSPQCGSNRLRTASGWPQPSFRYSRSGVSAYPQRPCLNVACSGMPAQYQPQTQAKKDALMTEPTPIRTLEEFHATRIRLAQKITVHYMSV